ncbi:MAG TPA: protein kinase, partial [Thermoanaerobaculia bacterium]|nr:protein kinase [Thermoanaerobaculia bacterium]
AKDPQIMGRFEREAQVLASLNHPNIASIYGLEENGGQRALVMELASGEELSARIARGKLPLDEVLRIALAIAEALEAAHDKGIIHRDLKPANIKLGDGSESGGGRIKILDFGLAKALQGDLASSSSGIDLTRSPTLSVAATQAGMILGTASYMSPEQARALQADRRADIWSFGAILFEMLAGRRVFVGDTVADTIAKVLEREPDWSLLPATTPPAIKSLLERCLVKSPRQRLQAIGDARLVIEETLADLARPLSADRSAPVVHDASTPAAAAKRAPRWLTLVPWVVAALAVAWAAASNLRPRSSAPAESPLVVDVTIGATELYNELGASFAISPDGRTLAYVERRGSERRLFVRALDQLASVPLALDEIKSNGPYHPFVSADGNWIGYALPAELRKVQVAGGSPLTICKVDRSRGATWLPGDTIVFAPNPRSGLSKVAAAGGEPQPLTELDAEQSEVTHRWPQGLPGGKYVLFTVHASDGSFDAASLQVVELATGKRTVVYRGGSYGRYAPTGHLVFLNRGTLFAVPFDLDSLETRGAPVPVVQKISTNVFEGGGQFDFSANGRLVYAAEAAQAKAYPAVWVDRDGRSSLLTEQPGLYANPRLSPDGKRLSLTVLDGTNWDIWVYDIERGVSTRLTFDEAAETEQIWSPDGEQLVYSSDRDGPDALYRKRADGSGEAERLTQPAFPQWAQSWSPDGRYVTYIESRTQYDMGTLDLSTGETKPFLATEFGEGFQLISPNGRFVAYASNESGSYHVYVRPFPSGEGKWQVSDAPGVSPRWRTDGRELMWRTDEGVVGASVEADGPTFRAGRPREIVSGRWKGGLTGIGAGGLSFADYDMSADGQRFVMFQDTDPGERSEHQHLTLVTRWFEQLESLEGNGK